MIYLAITAVLGMATLLLAALVSSYNEAAGSNSRHLDLARAETKYKLRCQRKALAKAAKRIAKLNRREA